MLHRGQMQARHDPYHYLPRFLRLEAKVAKRSAGKLRDFVRAMSGGATPKAEEHDKYYADSKTGVPFVRVQNLSVSGHLLLDDVKYINEETHSGMLARSQVQADDLLVKITGVGRMAVASVPPNGFEGNINQHIARIRTDSRHTSEVLAAWLNTDVAESLAKRRSTGGTRPALDYGALRSLPVIFDENALQLTRTANLAYANELARASDLLASINDLLLDELKIKLPSPPVSGISNRTFHTSRSDVTRLRFDPAYFEAKFTTLQESLNKAGFPMKSLRSMCSLLSNGRTPAKDEYSDFATQFPIIKVASYSGDLIDLTKVYCAITPQAMTARRGDIFILSAAHQPDFVGRFVKLLDEDPEEPTSFVGELICARANPDVISSDYLFALLSAPFVQDLVNREKRGQTSHIYPNDIGHLRLPVPDMDIQVHISREIRNRRESAKKIQSDARDNLRKARREIELLLLGVSA